MTIENIPLSATMTLETWLCQSDEQEIVFLTREIASFRTVPFRLFTVPAVS